MTVDTRCSRPRRRVASVGAVAVLVAVLAALGSGTAGATETPRGTRGAEATPTEPAPRPVDPNATCVAPGPDIVELPSPQRRLASDRGWHLTRGAGVTVAILDSGVDPATPQLSGRVDAGTDVAVPGYTGDADCLGQGTAMAGLVAAAVADGIGFHGVAPDARIVPIRVAGDDLTAPPDVLAAGLRAAVAVGARVVLVTVSSTGTSPDLAAAVAETAAADVLVVASAEVPTVDGGGYAQPAPYVSVLAVAAVGEDGAAAGESSGLPAIVDIAAPGSAVVSTLPGGGHTGEYTGPRPAAAYVAGVAALVRSAFPALSAAQVRTRLELTADRPGSQAPDPLVGWGVVNAEVALSAIIPAEASVGLPSTAAPMAQVVAPPQAAEPVDRTTVDRSLWIFGISAVLAVAALVALAVVPRGRRSRWRPTRSAAGILGPGAPRTR